MQTGRNVHIDVLRFIGISCIILAHVAAPNWIYQWRTFDVPLMVFVSGLVLANKTRIDSVVKYWIKRSKRLLIPVYLFLLLYIGGTYLFSVANGTNMPFTDSQIIESFFLLEGIGYVWIIRVFLLIAILAPLYIRLALDVHKKYIFFMLIILFSLIPDAAIHLGFANESFILREYILYAIGYGAVFLVGLKSASKQIWDGWRELLGYVCIFILLCVCCLYRNGSLPLLSVYKFPPQSLFILYGVIVSWLLWNVVRLFSFSDGMLKSFILFVGQNTIWIYLFHIPFVYYLGEQVEQWWLRFIFIYVISIILCFSKNKVLDLYLERYSWVSYLKG